MRLDGPYIEKVLPGIVQSVLSKHLADALSVPPDYVVEPYKVSGPVKSTLEKVPAFVPTLGEELNRILKTAASLDRVADSLESQGLYREAEEIDILANSIEAAMLGVGLKSDTDMDELRQLIEEQVKGKPGYLANKVGIVKNDASGRRLLSTEGRVYTTEKPSELSNLWKEGPDGNWYLQNAGDKYDVVFMGDKGFLQDRDGKMHPVPGMKEITDL